MKTKKKPESCYQKLERDCLPLIGAYHNDLVKIDRQIILENPTIPFLHWTKEWGTHMTTMPPADHECWPAKGEVVPYLFGHADRDHVLNQKRTHADRALNPYNVPVRVTHYFDGQNLRKVSNEQAKEIVEAYIRSIEQAWRRPAVAA